MQFDFVFFNWHHLTHSKLFFFCNLSLICVCLLNQIFLLFSFHMLHMKQMTKKSVEILEFNIFGRSDKSIIYKKHNLKYHFSIFSWILLLFSFNDNGSQKHFSIAKQIHT